MVLPSPPCDIDAARAAGREIIGRKKFIVELPRVAESWVRRLGVAASESQGQDPKSMMTFGDQIESSSLGWSETPLTLRVG